MAIRRANYGHTALPTDATPKALASRWARLGKMNIGSVNIGSSIKRARVIRLFEGALKCSATPKRANSLLRNSLLGNSLLGNSLLDDVWTAAILFLKQDTRDGFIASTAQCHESSDRRE